MSRGSTVRSAVDRQDVLTAVVTILGLVALVPAQLVSMITFDSLGWDTFVPNQVFMIVVPALLVAAVPLYLLRRDYRQRTALIVGAIVVAAYLVITWYLIQYYMLCSGPRC